MPDELPELADAGRLDAWNALRRPIWLFDPETCFGLYANAAALVLWGAGDLGELLSRDFSKLSPAVRTRTDRLRQVTADGGQVEERWTFYPRGRPVTVQAMISTVLLADGRKALLFEAAETEVEAEERRAVEALRHSSGPVGLFDILGQPLFSNPAAFAAYGPNADFLSRFVELGRGQGALSTAAAGDVVGAVMLMQTRAGPRWHHVDCRPLTDPVTGATSILLNERDVTDRVEAEAARAAAEQKAAMAEARQRFLADMSHELRTPLNAVLGFSAIMASSGLPDALKDPVARIQAAGERLAELVEQMIARSQIDEVSRAAPASTLSEAVVAVERAETAAADQDGRATRVLYVDDNESNRVLITTLLSMQGVECTTANDGAEGLAAASAGGWDLVLMDIQMPVMGGVEASRLIRALGTEAGLVPIIAVTANTLDEQIAQYLEAGMDDCVAKPVKPGELLAKLAHWADDARSGERRRRLAAA